MPSRRFSRTFACLLAALTGCAQSGPLLSKGTNVGTLKTSLSHMEYENQQLRREVASLKSEVRQAEDRLVQEESASEELSSRLKNATAMLKERGFGSGGELAGTDPNQERPRTTLPAGRSGRRLRKPPTAQIPGHLEEMPAAPANVDTSSNGWGSTGSDFSDDPASQSRRDSPIVWLPVVRGASDSTAKRR